MMTRYLIPLMLVPLFVVAAPTPSQADGKHPKKRAKHFEWRETNPHAAWSPRAGLQVVELRNRLYLMGGRTPVNPAVIPIPGASILWSDVWTSDDNGTSWEPLLETDAPEHWPPRAYFQAVTMKGAMYVLGGQDFNLIPNPACDFLPPGVPCDPPLVPASQFFNDVWCSRDGFTWHLQTESAPWEGRAGLSAVVFRNEIYVMAGSYNDDPAIIGGPPTRVYLNDVWKSADGINWELVTEQAPWAPRAGAVAVTKGRYMYLVGGEDGFLCDPAQPERCPPYYNDVWRTSDGAHWELMTENAAWAPRPGHQVVVLGRVMVLFGGFGLSTDPFDPFKPSNPIDMWVSWNGESWYEIDYAPWNAETPEEIKYDFKALVVKDKTRGEGRRPVLLTFGGDRETFDFADPENYLRVDNDVWQFSLKPRRSR